MAPAHIPRRAGAYHMAPVPTLRHDTRGAESETSGQDYELQHPGAVHRQRLSLTRVMAMGKMVPVRGRFLPENATGIGRKAIAPGRDGGRRCDRFHPWQGEGARQAPPAYSIRIITNCVTDPKGRNLGSVLLWNDFRLGATNLC